MVKSNETLVRIQHKVAKQTPVVHSMSLNDYVRLLLMLMVESLSPWMSRPDRMVVMDGNRIHARQKLEIGRESREPF